jgi:pimeloyl-ACP methyl ester carboxylesterase
MGKYCYISFVACACLLLTGCTSKHQNSNHQLHNARHVPLDGESGHLLSRVASNDGTLLAVECAGQGPSLVIVHGGIGDRTRWTPLFPHLTPSFTVCAMDRRGRGESGDSPDYSLQKEVEDVLAVVNSRSGPVYLLGHSFGALCALEAAYRTDKIQKLALYEPPLQERIDPALISKMERLIHEGNSEQALLIFLEGIVMIAPREVAAMRARPSWPTQVASISSSMRQIRAVAGYRFDADRVRTLNTPTLLLTGSETASPHLKQAIGVLMDSLPNRRLFVFDRQEHNAMDTVPDQFAQILKEFWLGS